MIKTIITMLERIILSIIVVVILFLCNICIIGGGSVVILRQGEKLGISDIVMLVSKLIFLTTISIHVGPWQFDAKLLGLCSKKLQVRTNLHVSLGRCEHVRPHLGTGFF